ETGMQRRTNSGAYAVGADNDIGPDRLDLGVCSALFEPHGNPGIVLRNPHASLAEHDGVVAEPFHHRVVEHHLQDAAVHEMRRIVEASGSPDFVCVNRLAVAAEIEGLRGDNGNLVELLLKAEIG